MTIHLHSYAAVVLSAAAGAAVWTPAAATASGCFGGEPDILPRQGAVAVPCNAQVRIARRDTTAVRWIGPDGVRVAAGERRVGRGRSVARILTAASPLRAGLHELHLRDPDLVHRFTVGSSRDETSPRLSGELTLEAHHAPEPASSCPENTWIRLTLPVPWDDVTEPDGFSYLVFLGEHEGMPWRRADLLVHAESVASGTVTLRIGETGCGCIPRIRLRPGAQYRVRVRAVDVAGRLSSEALTAEIRIPD